MIKTVKRFLNRARGYLSQPVLEAIDSENKRRRQDDTGTVLSEQVLANQYQILMQLKLALPNIMDSGYRIFSESDEDGILHYIFSLAQTTNKKLVDIGAGGPKGSNTANLLLNHGWTGLLIEGDENTAIKTEQFYKKHPATRNYPPKMVSKLVTSENINKILIDSCYAGEIDLLCIDIDGIDYWIWKAIDCISPRVVLVEYQCIWGPEEAVSVPYSENFRAEYVGQFGVYSGASLAAFVKLAQIKGYRLVACNRYGYNAFFVRNDIAHNTLSEIPPASCFAHPFTHWAIKELLPKVTDRVWTKV
jgi:hypothetical protein